MRFIGLTLCLLASSLGARAESTDERIAALEARVKTLEQALQAKSAPAPAAAVNIDGTYTGALPNGATISFEFQGGKVVALLKDEKKSGTYEVVGQNAVVTIEDKTETLSIDGDTLRYRKGNEKIDLVKSK
jgi:hypothetical protein